MEEKIYLCRICLKCLSTDTKHQMLKDLEENLLECVTEIDLTIPSNPLACEECLASVLSLYQFKQTCCATERLVQDLRSRSLPFEDALKYINIVKVKLEEEHLKVVDIEKVKSEEEHLEVVDYNDIDFNTEIPTVFQNNNAVASYTCFTCSSPFNSKSHKEECTKNNSTLNGHEKVHSELRPHKCDYCEYRSNRKYNLSVHLRKHTGANRKYTLACHVMAPKVHLKSHKEKCTTNNSTLTGPEKGNLELRLHKCNYCEYKSNRKTKLLEHLRKHTGEKPFACDLCEYKCARKDRYESHLLVHGNVKRFNCNDCDYGTNRKDTLACHVMVHKVHLKSHKEKSTKNNSTLNGREKVNSELRLHKCSYCEYKFSRKNKLLEHLRTHTGEKPFVCDLCEYKSARKDTYKLHRLVHGNVKQFYCNDCDYGTNRKGYLARHVMVHKDHRPFKCGQCNFSTATSYLLNRHLQRQHTGIFMYKCDVCGYRTSVLQALKAHVRTHTGKKPYKCNVCTYSSSQKILLWRHMSRHTNERNIKCTKCDYVATKNYILKIHMRTHTGEKPYNCDKCSYSSAQSGGLVVHRKLHLSRPVLKCDSCDFKTLNISQLNHHKC